MNISPTMGEVRPPSISVVIPVFNSDQSLVELAVRLEMVFSSIIQEEYELIFVDDYSRNKKSWETLERLTEENSSVMAIRLSKNFGQASALLCGMAHASGEWVVTMDDDGQHKPEDIPVLLEERTHDVVIAHFPEKKCGFGKKMSSAIKGYFDILLLNKPVELKASSLRLIKKRIVEKILTIKTSRPFLLAMLLSVTSDIVNVEVTHDLRRYGKSNYSFRKSLSLFSNMLFNNSSFMLRCMSFIGFVIAFCSSLLGVGIVVKTLFAEYVVPGWTSLIVVTLISTGVIIFCLGVIGEYIARLLATAENHVTWAIQQKIDSNYKK